LGVLKDLVGEPARPGKLAIPEYFGHPTPENDIPLADLGALYFKETAGDSNK
jgi:hypothetical protein